MQILITLSAPLIASFSIITPSPSFSSLIIIHPCNPPVLLPVCLNFFDVQERLCLIVSLETALHFGMHYLFPLQYLLCYTLRNCIHDGNI